MKRHVSSTPYSYCDVRGSPYSWGAALSVTWPRYSLLVFSCVISPFSNHGRSYLDISPFSILFSFPSSSISLFLSPLQRHLRESETVKRYASHCPESQTPACPATPSPARRDRETERQAAFERRPRDGRRGWRRCLVVVIACSGWRRASDPWLPLSCTSLTRCCISLCVLPSLLLFPIVSILPPSNPHKKSI